MDQTLKTKLDDAEQGLLESYEEGLSYGDEESKKHEFYLKLFEEILIIRNKATQSEAALALAKERSTVEDFENAYEAENQSKNFRAKGTNEYKKFQARLKQIKDAFDQEISTEPGTSNGSNLVEGEEFVMETEICTIDPLTKRQMENPVKNKICGHHYEKSSVLEAIRINPRLRCPVAGCGNNQFVQKLHLVDDDALKMRIRKMRNNEEEGDDPLAYE